MKQSLMHQVRLWNQTLQKCEVSLEEEVNKRGKIGKQITASGEAMKRKSNLANVKQFERRNVEQ